MIVNLRTSDPNTFQLAAPASNNVFDMQPGQEEKKEDKKGEKSKKDKSKDKKAKGKSKKNLKKKKTETEDQKKERERKEADAEEKRKQREKQREEEKQKRKEYNDKVSSARKASKRACTQQLLYRQLILSTLSPNN